MCIPDIVFVLNKDKVNKELNNKETIIIGSSDRLKKIDNIKDKIYIFDIEKDKNLSENQIKSIEEFEESIKDVLIVVTYKFHGLVLSIMNNRIPITDKKSFKCKDLMLTIFGEKIGLNLMFNSTSNNVLKEIESCKNYVKKNRKLLEKKITEYIEYTKLFYINWDEEYIINILFRSKKKLVRDYIDYKTINELMHDLKLGSNSPYKWGLKEKNIILKEHVDWLEEDIYKNTVLKSPYNIDLFDQQFNDITHRWGWNYIIRSIKGISSIFGIYLDTYLDSSYDSVSYLIPWVGILHHPDNIPKEYSEASLSRIFNSIFWKLSKPFCKKIIVLSDYIKEQSTKYIDKNLLIKLYHPMNQCLNKWNYNKWKYEGEKLYTIGNWLRNEFSIYLLDYKYKYKINIKDTIPPNDIYIYKITDIPKVELINVVNTNELTGCYKSNLNNKWIYFANEYLKKYELKILEEEIKDKERIEYMEIKIKEMINSVIIEERKSDIEYDELLSSSIILLDLIDCSACNVLLECITAEVPIYIKRHPALEEYIGEEYPLFYNDIEELKITELDIKRGNKYLKNLDKLKFTTDYFINDLIELSKLLKSEMK